MVCFGFFVFVLIIIFGFVALLDCCVLNEGLLILSVGCYIIREVAFFGFSGVCVFLFWLFGFDFGFPGVFVFSGILFCV